MTAPSQTADRMACAEAQSRLVPRPSAQSKKESPGRAKEFGHALSAGSSHLLMTSLPCRPSTALRRRLPAARRCARMEATRAPPRGLTPCGGHRGSRPGRSRRSGSADPVSRSHGDWGCADDGRAVQDPGDPGESRQACAVRNVEGAGRSSGFLLAVPDRKQARCGPTSRALPSQCLLNASPGPLHQRVGNGSSRHELPLPGVAQKTSLPLPLCSCGVEHR
jgi:hypothetical protein